MNKIITQCLGIFNSKEPSDTFFELMFEALNDYKQSKNGDIKCQHTVNQDTIG